ncbi:hypothetical protein JCM10207_005396 [Rhodosporidiobolus poonsookiae]
MHRTALLRHLALAFLPSSPQSAVFYAELLHSLDPTAESSAFLLAQALVATKEHLEALWVLRQPATFVPATAEASDDPFGLQPAGARRWPPQPSTSTGKLTRPAVDCSVRCARLYGDACAALGRAKEGREALARVLQPGVPLATPTALDEPLPGFPALPESLPTLSTDDPALLDLELARLAVAAHERDRAVLSFQKVLQRAPTCWEAIVGLCELGAPPDVDVLLPQPKKVNVPLANGQANGQQMTQQQQQQAVKPLSTSNGLGASYPPPLGPSQTAVNTAWGGASSGGLFTPTDVSAGAGAGARQNGGLFGQANGNGKGKGKEVVGLFGNVPVLRRTGSGRYGGADVSMMGDTSTADESSFDASFYPTQPLSFGPPRHPNPALSNPSGSLFTPPAAALPTATAPGVKRTRAGNVAPASMSLEDDSSAPAPARAPANGRRPIRAAPGENKSRATSASAASGAPGTRRSSRLSAHATSAAMAPSRSQSSASGRTGGTTATGARDKKRTKAGAGPSVLSDSTSTVGSDALSPVSSSSPGPSSPPAATVALTGSTGSTASGAPSLSALAALAPTPADLAARNEAEAYVLSVLRAFAHAEAALSGYDAERALEALAGLPGEQARQARAMRAVGRARFERGEYEKAEKAFESARKLAPSSLRSMDLYSTTLWHLRSPTSLSYLSQELMSLSTSHPASWIASGNVFSHLEDHAAALRCFRRAAQLDDQCVYAYVLAGHEGVMMEEWDKAMGFFREAVRRDTGGRCYSAWFGLGNVYLKTGKYTLAEYHFRRALEINPGSATLVCCVGTVLEKLSRTREALEMYERAVSLAPDSPLARFKRVRLMLAYGKYQPAEADLLQLKHLAPAEPNVHYLLGKLYKQLGPQRRAEMLQAFAMAQDLEPRMASAIREHIEAPPADIAGMDVDDSRMSDIGNA